jgi:hypothetical protein
MVEGDRAAGGGAAKVAARRAPERLVLGGVAMPVPDF